MFFKIASLVVLASLVPGARVSKAGALEQAQGLAPKVPAKGPAGAVRPEAPRGP